jgi:NTE family protein
VIAAAMERDETLGTATGAMRAAPDFPVTRHLALQAELAATGAGDTIVIEPDEGTLASFGADLMSPSIWLPAFAAGREQGKKVRYHST